MVTSIIITRFLNKELQTRKIPDSSKNGLQVKGKEVKKIGFAVDASLETFKKAKKAGCQMIIVHHGLFWKKQKDPNNVRKARVTFLKKNKILLYASHLPLDRHKKYGNNIELCKIIGVEKPKLFGNYKGAIVGYIGKLSKPAKLSSILKKLNKVLKTKSYSRDFAKKKIKTIAIVSGGGDFAIDEAIKIFGDKIKIIVNQPTELSFLTEKQIKISFIYFPFKPIHPLVKTQNFDLFNLKDMASNKAYTVGRRGEYRDYVDLFFLLKSGLKLRNIIKDAQKRFAGGFSERLFLEQLTYLDDLKDKKVDFIKQSFSEKEITDFLKNQIEQY